MASSEEKWAAAEKTLIFVFSAAALLLGALFFCALIERGAYALIGWHYPVETIGQYLGIKNQHGRLLTWDHSFLFLAAAFCAYGLAAMAQESVDARRMTAWHRALSPHPALAKPSETVEPRHKHEGEHSRRKNQMSGWRRLWIVLSILFAVPSFWFAYLIEAHAYVPVSWHGDNDAFWRLARNTPALSDCDWTTAKADGQYRSDGSYDPGTYDVTCESKWRFGLALLWSLVPAMLMAAIGLTVRWIYRGFRPPLQQAAQDPKPAGPGS